MGNLTYILAIPTLSVALVAWAVASRRLAPELAAARPLAAVLLGVPAVDAGPDRRHRRQRQVGFSLALDANARGSTPGAGRRAQAARAPAPAETPQARGRRKPRGQDERVRGLRRPGRGSSPPRLRYRREPAEWPGFRGPDRDGIIRGVRIETDWSQSPPVELWRRPIGPGWSSFAVRGDLLYTQEQRGDDEVVACYKVSTGEPVWRHRDAARFWESNGGAGPRGTPTLSNGRVYTFGATGILNALDAGNGAVVWSRNAASDTGTKIPDWGFASSPLVVDDLVIVAASGTLAAYDSPPASRAGSARQHGGSYSSPHLVTIDGVAQILLLSGPGATSVAPADGTLLWEHAWRQAAPSCSRR